MPERSHIEHTGDGNHSESMPVRNTEKMKMRHECWIDKPDRCENRWSSSVSHSREIHNALRNNRNSEREINLREIYRKLAIGFT